MQTDFNEEKIEMKKISGNMENPVIEQLADYKSTPEWKLKVKEIARDSIESLNDQFEGSMVINQKNLMDSSDVRPEDPLILSFIKSSHAPLSELSSGRTCR